MIRVTASGKPYRQRIWSAVEHVLHGKVNVTATFTRPSRQTVRLTLDEQRGAVRLVELDDKGVETVLWER